MVKTRFKVGQYVDWTDNYKYSYGQPETASDMQTGHGVIRSLARHGPRGRGKVFGMYVEDTRLTRGERYLSVDEDVIDVVGPRPSEVFPDQVAQVPAATPVNPKAAYGATKPSVALIPPVALLHEAMAYEDGARKYGPYNWRTNPVEAMTYVNAMYRHLGLWLDGDELTSDTNVHNLGSIRACCGILLDCIEAGTLIDNRPPKAPSDAVQNRLKAQKVEEAKTRKG